MGAHRLRGLKQHHPLPYGKASPPLPSTGPCAHTGCTHRLGVIPRPLQGTRQVTLAHGGPPPAWAGARLCAPGPGCTVS